MKMLNKIIRTILLAVILACSAGIAGAQVNGFAVNCPGGTVQTGVSFPVNLSFNWTNSTTSALLVLHFDPTKVYYDANCQAVLPSCMSVVVNNTAGTATITISNLNACTNTNSISVNLCFGFNCPDTCAGVTKTAVFTGRLSDNLNTVQEASCTTTDITPNNTALTNSFYSYNSLTAEVTYQVFYQAGNCFKVKNPKFLLSYLSACTGTITQAWGSHFTYTVDAVASTITPNAAAINSNQWDYMYYTIKLPCNSCLGQALKPSITLQGENCSIPNSVIAGPVTATYTIPVTPAPNPAATIVRAAYTNPNRFYTKITNTGNTPLNLTDDEFLPLVHVLSVQQAASQPGLNNSVVYYDCSSVASPAYTLTGNTVNTNAPANTTKIHYTINNLLPNNTVEFYTAFDLSSSCAGAVGASPYKDSTSIAYNCAAPPNTCISCGTGGGGVSNGFTEYNPLPVIKCMQAAYIPTCHNLGDTLNFCFSFKNIGDAELQGGHFSAYLPNWLQYVAGSVSSTGLPSQPIDIPGSNIKWQIPIIPLSPNTFIICFKAVINAGAVGGGNSFPTNFTDSTDNIGYAAGGCPGSFNICAFGAIGVEKRVKGSLDAGFGTSATGIAGSVVDYEITMRNTGTEIMHNLEVIDRFPAIGDLTILGNPSALPRNSQFNMQPTVVPVIPSCTVTSSNDPNVCTGWAGVALNCGPPVVGTWSGGSKAYRFVFGPSVTLMPAASLTFTFQLKIPAGTATGLHACNSAGFIAAPPTGSMNASESNIVCVEVEPTPVTPVNCCNSMEKKITAVTKVDNDILSVSLALAVGPKKMKKIAISLVQFEVKHAADCDICVKDPRVFGNIVPGQGAMIFAIRPEGQPFSHIIQWQDDAGRDWSNGNQVNFTIPLPPRSAIACCCDTINYCIRYTFTDEDCKTCDTVICYTVYNGKNCNGGGTNNNGGGKAIGQNIIRDEGKTFTVKNQPAERSPAKNAENIDNTLFYQDKTSVR